MELCKRLTNKNLTFLSEMLQKEFSQDMHIKKCYTISISISILLVLVLAQGCTASVIFLNVLFQFLLLTFTSGLVIIDNLHTVGFCSFCGNWAIRLVTC